MKLSLRQTQKIIIAAVTVIFFLGITGFSAKCRDIEDSVLRLHVIANSDSAQDQELKLKVRDAVLLSGKDIFSGAGNVKDAEKKINDNSDEILAAARQVIKDEGFDYNVHLEITDDNFPTKTYGDTTLPAGKYRAVKIVIGEGAGHNWWCVMFPALCIPGASEDVSIDDVLTDSETEFVKSDPKIDVRFKIVDVFDKMTKIFKIN